MTGPDETFIVRVRRGDDQAVVEQPRLGRRYVVHDVSEIGPLVRRWTATTPEPLPPDARRQVKARQEGKP